MHISLRHKQQHLSVDLHAEGGRYRIDCDGREYIVEVQHPDAATLVLVVDGRRYRVDLARTGRERLVGVGGEVYTFVSEAGASPAHHVATVASPEITAPMPGKVLQVLVHPGDQVRAGDTVLILEAMKMESRLVAEAAGTVAEVRVAAGDMVDGGQVLAVLEYSPSETVD